MIGSALKMCVSEQCSAFKIRFRRNHAPQQFLLHPYAPRYRAEWLAKISEAGVRRRAELYYQQFDALAALRQHARRELFVEARKYPAMRLLR